MTYRATIVKLFGRALIVQEPRGWTRKKLQEIRFPVNAFP